MRAHPNNFSDYLVSNQENLDIIIQHNCNIIKNNTLFFGQEQKIIIIKEEK